MSTGAHPDPDDFFAETRMSFGDHIEELRSHLIKAIAGFLVALIFSFFIGQPVLTIITRPVETQLKAFYNRRLEQKKKELAQEQATPINKPTEFVPYAFRRDQLDALIQGKSNEEVSAFKRPVIVKPKSAAEETPWWQRLLGFGGNDEQAPVQRADDEAIEPSNLVVLWISHQKPGDEASLILPAIREIGEFDTLATMNVTEAFMVYFKVCLLCGLVLGSPWIFYQIWAFIAAGLYPHEKKLVNVYLPVSLGLFLAGVFMCQIVVIPRAIEALLWFNEWIGLKPDLRLNEWLGFAIMLPVVFGVSFQTPLVMVLLGRLGIMSAKTFRDYRRIAWFVLAIFAAVITPTPDAVTMLLLWVPIGLLYELGIFLVAMAPQPEDELADSETDTVVEV